MKLQGPNVSQLNVPKLTFPHAELFRVVREDSLQCIPKIIMVKL
jgi:hypothetical protein